MIALKDIEVHRNGKRIVGPLSLDVCKNDFIGVIGPNGAGKSTLLHVVLGLEAISCGMIQLAGKHFFAPTKSFRNLVQKNIGVLFQNHYYEPDIPLTVEEIVFFGRSNYGQIGFAYSKEDKENVEQAITMLELESLRKQLYRDLSGGEKQKVQLARLLAQEASVLLLDEPASGLDLDWQERLTQIVETIFIKKKKTIVMVTHDVDRLPTCCNKLVMLKEGQIVASGEPLKIAQPQTLSELYNCNMDVVVRNGRIHAFSQGVEVTS